MAAPVAASIGTQGFGANGAGAACGVPSGVVSGSKVIVYTFTYWTGTTAHTSSDITPPTGFTIGGTYGEAAWGGFYNLIAWWWKDATGSDTGTYTFTAASSGTTTALALRITGSSGVGTSPFVDTFTGRGDWVNNLSSLTIPSFTPTANDSLLLASVNGGGTVSATGWTTVGTQGTNADGDTNGVMSLTQTTAAALNPTFTQSSNYVGVLIATLRGSSTTTVGKTASVAWNVTSLVSKTASTAWNVASSAITVTKTGSAAWTVRALVTKTASARWNAAGNALFPTTAGPRALLDQNGNPLFLNAEWAFGMPVKLSTSEMNTYFASRASYGINAVVVALVCGTTGGNNNDGRTYDGITPFTNTALALDSSYWARVDTMVSLAAQYGITILADPMGAEDWLAEMSTAGSTNVQAYGAALASRYASSPNIVWMLGIDYGSGSWSTYDSLYLALRTGLLSTSPKLLTIQFLDESDGFSQGATNATNWRDIVDFGSPYTYTYTYDRVLAGYGFNPADARNSVPVWMSESNFELENVKGDALTTDETLRRQFWWTVTSGGTGVARGHRDLWQFNSGWASSALNTAAIAQQKMAVDLLKTLPWATLDPTVAGSLITSGRGSITNGANSDVLGTNWATGAVSADGTTALMYVPTSRSITVNTALVTGSSPRAYWWDPADGSITAEPSPASPTHPGANGDGTQDWVYLITTVPITVSKTATSRWNVSGKVTKTASTAWNVATVVSKTASSQWTVSAFIGKTAQSRWTVSANVAKTTSSAWTISALVGKTASSAWNTNSGVLTATKTASAAWNVSALLTKTASTSWTVKALVTKTGPTAWNVATAVITVTKTAQARWIVSAIVVKTASTRWATDSEAQVVAPPERGYLVPVDQRGLFVPSEDRGLRVRPA